MLFISALELVRMCQKHGILIGTDCVIHFCDEQGTWHEMTHAGMAMERKRPIRGCIEISGCCM